MRISRLAIASTTMIVVFVGCSSNGKKLDSGFGGSFGPDVAADTTGKSDVSGAGGTAGTTTSLATGGTAGTTWSGVGTGGSSGSGGSGGREAGVPDAPDTQSDVPIGGGGGALVTGGNMGVGTGGHLGTGGAPGVGGMSSSALATGGTSTVVTTTTGGMTGKGGTTGGGGTAMGGAATGGKAGTMTTGGSTGGGGVAGSTGTPAGVPGPSCAGLAATCGPSGNESCCAGLLVPGGTFFRSYDGVGFTNKSYPATISTFALDKYEATVGRFRAFVNAGMGTQISPPAAGAAAHPLIPNSGWSSAWNANLPADTTRLQATVKCDSSLTPSFRTWTDTPGDNENRPMNCLTWYEAFAFCAWDGGRLPTEAEWNYAAAGGSEQREYPWGSGIDPSKASYNSFQDSCTGDGLPGCTAADVAFVGSKSAGNGRWGHADLAGNLMEWTLDYYGNYSTPCADCANLVADDCRAIRGGYFYYIPENSRTAVRFNDFIPEAVYSSDGVRCARSAQ